MLPRLPLPRIDGLTEAFREWRRSLLWASNPSGGGLIRCDHTSHGPLWKADLENDRWVLLSGSANPYSGTEVYESASGTWTAVPAEPALTHIYEENGVTGLNMQVVKVRPGFGPAASEWRFRFNRKGTAATGCTNDGCCPGVALGDTLTCEDMFYSTFHGAPTFTLTRTPGTCVYNGCLVIFFTAANAACGASGYNAAYHYQFDATNCTMSVNYKGFFRTDPSSSLLYCCVGPSDCTSTPVFCGIGAWVVFAAQTTCSPLQITFLNNGTNDAQNFPWEDGVHSVAARIRITP